MVSDILPETKQLRAGASHLEQAGRMDAARLVEDRLGLAKPLRQFSSAASTSSLKRGAGTVQVEPVDLAALCHAGRADPRARLVVERIV